MIDTIDTTSNRSSEYLRLIQELKQSFNAPIDIAQKIFEQGKKDNLPNEMIREDIELALDGVIKERRLRKVLPLELKRTYTSPSPLPSTTPPPPQPEFKSDSNSALSAELSTTGAMEKMEKMRLAIDWLSGMEEGDRERFKEGLPKGKMYTIALEDKCRDYVREIVRKLSNEHIGSFLNYTEEIAALAPVFQEKLAEERLSRERKRDLESK